MIRDTIVPIFLGLFFLSNPTQGEPAKGIASEKNVNCLAMNMYHEARNQGTAGQLAVTAVVLNRVNDKRFPNTICGVIHQGPTRESWTTRQHSNLTAQERKYYPVKNRCQFSWYCDGKSDTPYDRKQFEYFKRLSLSLLTKELDFIDITDGAVFYHADYVTPSWAKSKKRTIEIQDHIFYTWK